MSKTLSICIICWLLAHWLNPLQSNAATLHYIVFADTDDPSIGEANLKTYNYLTNGLLGVLKANSGLAIKTSTFFGANCTVNQLDKTLAELAVSANDVVFFYFAGHGWNRRLNDYPSLIFGNASANRETLETSSRDLVDVYNAIRRKQPRLSIVIGEACNKERMDEPQAITSARPVFIMKPPTVNAANVSKLFNNWAGGLMLCSSGRNQYSHSDSKGGWMSVAFQNTMSEMTGVTYKGMVDWRTVAERVKDKTVQVAQAGGQEQEPQFSDTDLFAVSSSATTSRGLTTHSQELSQSNAPCAPVTSYVNETALAGIHEDLPMLHEMYAQITSNNAEEYAEMFSRFYKNQKSFYDNLGQAVFYQSAEIPEHCKASLKTTESWVMGYARDVNQKYAVINKYAGQPNRLVQQARSDLPSIIRRLEEILERLDR